MAARERKDRRDGRGLFSVLCLILWPIPRQESKDVHDCSTDRKPRRSPFSVHQMAGVKLYHFFTFSLPVASFPVIRTFSPSGGEGQVMMAVTSRIPVLDLVMEFLGGDFIDRGGELHRAGGLLDLTAQAAGHREQL